MGLRREVAQRMRDSGHTAKEVREFASAKKPDGTPQDIELIIQSATFEHMLESRRKWVENALKSKQLGGQGLTYKQAMKVIDNYYIMKKGRKTKKSIFDFLKTSYRPKQRLQTKREFQTAITKKSIIGRTIGKGYGEKLQSRYNPHLRRCSQCHGTGTKMNIYNQPQMCFACNGTGVERRRFI